MLQCRLVVAAVGALVTLLTAGCASAGPGDVPGSTTVGENYLCTGLSIPREAVADRVPVSDIEDRGRVALAEAVWDDGGPLGLPPEENWFVATVTDEQVSIMRDLVVVPDPASGGTAPDHAVLTVEWVDEATNLEPGWYVRQSSWCALSVDLGDLTVPDLEFRSSPSPESRELSLLVTESSCNSGHDAEGRIEVVSVEETADRVSLILGVRPPRGAQNCPSNPATPFTVTLTEPLGNREVVDGGLAEPRPLLVDG
jgi:hypothetical protein